MNKELDIEIVDLGTATDETKGTPGIVNEPQGLFRASGISDAD